ncbi:MAG: porin family protein [Bacteroidetes bacterium]|nr:porin family protein [Bacteroidota bacterium]
MFHSGVGGYAGLMFDYIIQKHLAAGTGLAWERKGTLFRTSVNTFDYHPFKIDYFFTFDYLTIPLLVKARFGNKVRFLASAGPYFSILISQAYTNNIEGAYGLQTIGQETFSRSLPYDFGFTGSLGVEFMPGKEMAFSISASDHVSLINTNLFPVIKSPYGPTFNNSSESYLNSVILSLGFTWYFTKKK